jgi:hypothetical protein
MIDRHYGHLAQDSEDAIRARLDARSDVLAFFWRAAQASSRTDASKSLQIGDGAYRDRTGDLRLAKPALSQLS